jgi:hypothetical protein
MRFRNGFHSKKQASGFIFLFLGEETSKAMDAPFCATTNGWLSGGRNG